MSRYANAKKPNRDDRAVRRTRIQEQREADLLARQEHDKGKKIGLGKLVPMTRKQGDLIDILRLKRLVSINGPAGTAKTFISVSFAAEALQAGEIDKIVITRPMVECGKPMGALPGDENQKFNPWIENMMEIFEGKLGKTKARNYLQEGRIYAIPLERARGRTFINSIVILDEAQNSTQEQMKMFLTRMGSNSKVFVCGDQDQSDLPKHVRSGFDDLIDIHGQMLSSEQEYFEFDENDIVRDPMVKSIIIAYRRMNARKEIRMVA